MVVVILLGSGCITEIYRGEVAHVPTYTTVHSPDVFVETDHPQVLKSAFCVTIASGMVAGGLHLFTLQHLQHLDLIISWQVSHFLFLPL